MIELLIFMSGAVWAAALALLWRDLIGPDGLFACVGAALKRWQWSFRRTLGLCPPCFSVWPTLAWATALAVASGWGFVAWLGAFVILFPLSYTLTAWLNGRI